MRIQTLSISNFRAITQLNLQDLQDTVIIAGPNGCGKSCVFDAIRLLKSAYGGYQPNEWQNWFGEFQINVNQRQSNWLVMLQDRTLSLQVTTEISLSQSEVTYLSTHATDILTRQVWQEVAPEVAGWRFIGATPLAANLRVHQPEVERRVKEALPELESDLLKPVHAGQIVITPDGQVTTAPSRVLELVFSQYDPHNIGVVDYHGPNRNYGREQVAGINLNIESSEAKLRQHALYNYANKYANLKSEMAGSYVRQLLAKEANAAAIVDQSLSDTLKELFNTFFPGKEFLGPRPTDDGRMLFPVRTPNGAEHDIDELSSGEKEVLYGYLRLRNAAPQHSVLLIDEPELHLNPRLIIGLASFYHRHLGRALDNQLWLVTHSDALIREAVGQKGFSVFHMQPPGQYEGPNQATAVQVGQDLERLVIELVGDLAAYRPGAKIVVLEGGPDSEFDVRMTCTLFPRFQASVNPISGGNKSRVSDLYDLLEEARRAGHIPGKFYAIMDSDGEATGQTEVPTRYKWDVYHIENYLIEPEFILRVLKDLNKAVAPVDTTEGVLQALQEHAERTIPSLVLHQLRTIANRALIDCVDLKFGPEESDISLALSEAAERSCSRIRRVVAEKVNREQLKVSEREFSERASGHLRSGEWRSSFRGRDVLRRFVGQHCGGVQYEIFRDLIIARMRDAEYEPPGMKKVIDSILNNRWA